MYMVSNVARVSGHECHVCCMVAGRTSYVLLKKEISSGSAEEILSGVRSIQLVKTRYQPATQCFISQIHDLF